MALDGNDFFNGGDVLLELFFNAHFEGHGAAGAGAAGAHEAQLNHAVVGHVDEFAVAAIGLQKGAQGVEDFLDFHQVNHGRRGGFGCGFGSHGEKLLELGMKTIKQKG